MLRRRNDGVSWELARQVFAARHGEAGILCSYSSYFVFFVEYKLPQK